MGRGALVERGRVDPCTLRDLRGDAAVSSKPCKPCKPSKPVRSSESSKSSKPNKRSKYLREYAVVCGGVEVVADATLLEVCYEGDEGGALDAVEVKLLRRPVGGGYHHKARDEELME